MTRDDVEESEPNYDSDEFVGTQARAPVTQPLIDQSCALKTPTLSTLAASDDTAVNPRAEVYSTERGLDDDAGANSYSSNLSGVSPSGASRPKSVKSGLLRQGLGSTKRRLGQEQTKSQRLEMGYESPEARDAAMRNELQERLERLIAKATEQGLDVKLGLANAEDYSEEENFKMGARLREKESLLDSLRALLSSLHTELAHRDAEYAKLHDPKKPVVEARLHECQDKVGHEETKNAALAHKLAHTKESLAESRSEAECARALVLEQLVQQEEERDRYQHVCVAELVRLLLQERDSARLMSSQRGSRENRAHLANHRSQRDKDHGEGRLLRELDRLGARTQRLRETLEGTERQMQIAGRGGAQVEQLKGRVVTLLGRQMREKTVKFQIQRSIEGVEKKVVVLSDHVERLMLHLKHEVLTKAQAQAAQGRALREVELLRARNDTIARKNLRKDRIIVELQEGERILEDQLRLLDDKYAELRAKLNATRHGYNGTVKRYMQQAQSLRLQWEKETRGALPLDLVPLPTVLRADPTRLTQSAPLHRRRSPSEGHVAQLDTRTVQSEGGGREGPLAFEASFTAMPAPLVPPPEISVSLLDMPTAASDHEPWSGAKLTQLHHALEQRRRSSSTPGA